MAVNFRRGQAAGPDVDLQSEEHPVGEPEFRVAFLAQFNKLFLADTVADMDILLPMLRDRRLPSRFFPIICAVNMADEKPGLLWKIQDRPNRPI